MGRARAAAGFVAGCALSQVVRIELRWDDAQIFGERNMEMVPHRAENHVWNLSHHPCPLSARMGGEGAQFARQQCHSARADIADINIAEINGERTWEAASTR